MGLVALFGVRLLFEQCLCRRLAHGSLFPDDDDRLYNSASAGVPCLEGAAANSLIELRLQAAQFVLGLAPSWKLPPVADRALMNCIYSPALADLASLSNPIKSDVDPLLKRALEELGLSLPTRSDAAWLLARHCMERIVSEVARPCEALHLLKQVCYSAVDVLPHDKYVGDGLDLRQLIGIYWSYSEPNENFYEPEQRLISSEPERQALLDAHARREAKEWLERHPSP